MAGKRLHTNGHARRLASNRQLFALNRAGRLVLLPLEEASVGNRVWSADADSAIKEGVAAEQSEDAA